VKVCHSYRDANTFVDALASIGCDVGSLLILYDYVVGL
jgi:hypothetical protein